MVEALLGLHAEAFLDEFGYNKGLYLESGVTCVIIVMFWLQAKSYLKIPLFILHTQKILKSSADPQPYGW